MKKYITLLITLVFFSYGYSQFNSDAPWMKNLNTKKNSSELNEPLKFQEIVEAFNQYWKDKDHTKKGSGYKPFKRWENYWKHLVKNDGTLPTPEEMLEVFYQKQELKNSRVDVSNWQSLGPYIHTNTGSWSSGQGRVNVIAVDPNTPTTYYIGAPAGGIWRSTDSGATWTPLSDNLLQIGVSAIAIDPRDSNVIYIGTGDDDAGDTYSLGVLKSIDGGQTWNSTGLSFSDTRSSINEVYIDPVDNDKIFVSSNKGFYKSTDKGVSFTRTLNQDLDDTKLKPGNSNIIYAATRNQVYKSSNNGDSFALASSGLPSSGGRIVLAVTSDASDNLYVLSADTNFAFQGVYRSQDSANNFTRLDDGTEDLFGGSTQAWYDLAFEVSDNNKNDIYIGVLDVYKSTDEGASFSQWNSWSAPGTATYTHADIHMIRDINGIMFFGTDGGIYRSTNGTSTEDLTEGLAIGQFYRIAVSPQTSSNMVGGLQDNGGYAYSDNNWKNYYGADGMDTAIDPNNPNKYYGFIQNGGGLYFSNDAGATLGGSIGAPASENGNWITPLKMSKEGELYAGYGSLYRLEGGSFNKISQSFSSSLDGIEIDPLDNDIIYTFVGGELYKSEDRGVNFTNIETFTGSFITSVAVNSTNNDIVYLTTSNSVFKSVNGGVDFENISFNLPSDAKLIVKHQAFHPNNPIYLGTSLGVYRLDDTANTWEAFLNNLPNVAVRDLEINENDGNITAATYGRGVWRSNIPVVSVASDLQLESVTVDNNSQIVCDSVSPKIIVKNNGTDVVTSFNIQFVIDEGNPISQSWTGNLNSGSTTEVEFSETDITGLGEHKLSFEVLSSGDVFQVNNTGSLSISKNDSDTVGINEFESNNDDLLILGALWERGIPTGTLLNDAASGQNVYGTNLAGNYVDSSVSYLISNCYDLSLIESPILKFNMAFDIELDWDFVNVEYSLNGGGSWSILGSASDANWYNSNTLPNNVNCNNCPGAQWTGTDSVLKEYSYDLISFTNEESFIFRFNFVSDQAVNREGVIIDDLSIEGNLLSIDDFENAPVLSLFPNPSSDVFNIQWRNANNVSYTVTDLAGKLIVSRNTVSSSENVAQINLSSFAKGMYFLNVNLDGVEETMKLIKN
ncbi:T9SS C-terminal target domain-containing protein [Aquimarina sp. AD1]|uniref:T9SS type A sorting domain-containing protein n=1 Tax=Aquimarina sp. (strain AD1) TaxID=1714848 RepID=UPI000E4AD4CA|nr:T9SS type A sorting domain-containing protein [Aquimarina sp. AD1]AXT56335.1 T9SS C-terminal target domain-containing protein [Aquimarina sp. AD1]RKN11220.1 T9SS C-terminal target domain-containing protein [Aquimarina sp. AD1]